MATQTTTAATLICSMGVGPSQLVVLPKNRMCAQGQIAANVMDHVPFVNVMPFPLCNSIANPAVAAATAAKMGAFTPAACLPVIPTPWTPGSSTVLIGGMPALNNSSTCMCAYGGAISIVNPVAVTVSVP